MFQKLVLIALLVGIASAQLSAGAIPVSSCTAGSTIATDGTAVKYASNANIIAVGNLYTGLCSLDSFTVSVFSAAGSTAISVVGAILQVADNPATPPSVVAVASAAGLANQTSATVTFTFPNLQLTSTNNYALGIEYSGAYEAYYVTDNSYYKIEEDTTGIVVTAGAFVISLTQGTVTSGSTSSSTGTNSTSTSTATGASASTTGSSSSTVAATTTGTAASTSASISTSAASTGSSSSSTVAATTTGTAASTAAAVTIGSSGSTTKVTTTKTASTASVASTRGTSSTGSSGAGFVVINAGLIVSAFVAVLLL